MKSDHDYPRGIHIPRKLRWTHVDKENLFGVTIYLMGTPWLFQKIVRFLLLTLFGAPDNIRSAIKGNDESKTSEPKKEISVDT